MWFRSERLLISVPAIVLFGGALICAFDYANSRYLMRQDIGQQSTRALGGMAAGVAHFVARIDAGDAAGRASQALAELARLRLADRVAVVDSGGSILLMHEPEARTDAAPPMLPAAEAAAVHRRPGAPRTTISPQSQMSALVPLQGGWHGAPAFLLLQRDATPSLARVDHLLGREWMFNMLLVMVMSALLALLLRGRLLLPTSRLAATAERIAAGDRSARVGMTGQNEVARAAQAFDRMADTIAATEQALEAERRKVAAVLEKLPVSVVMVDRDTRSVLFANDKWRELFEVDVVPGEDVLERLRLVRRERLDGSPVGVEELATPQVLRTGRPATVSDLVHVRSDGVRIPHVVHAVPVQLGEGRDFDAVIAVTLDRRELVALLDEVRSWERRYEKVAAATGQIVFEWDLVRRTVRRSGSSVEVIGHEAFPDIDTEWAYWLEHVHPEDREGVSQYLQRVLQTGESFDEEYRFRHGRGHWITIRDRGFFEFENGRPVRMYGTMDDITEQRALEEQLRQAQKMETVGTLAGGIAHDFNNALTGVIGHLDLVSGEIDDADPRAQHIRIARQAAQRCAELTRGLLAFSRQLESHPHPTDLGALVRESVDLLRHMLPSSVRLEAVAAPELPLALVDPVQVQQVLFNLCINARDAMPRGGAIRVSVACVEIDAPAARHPDARAGSHLEMTVQDTGCGITPDILPRIFEPFFTTKPVGEGTGLGLAMAYGIVRKHQGWIEVASTFGEGTTFRVCLPLASGAAPAQPAPRTQGPLQAHGETVLVADDDPMVRELAVTTLRRAGFEVVEAACGDAAARALREHPGRLSLVVLDLVMPGLSGSEVLRELHALSPETPVVISSGFAPSAAQGLEGVSAFLPKPWTPSQLLETVRAALGAGAARS